MAEASWFASAEIEGREIEMEDGTKAVIHFKHLSNLDFERYSMWRASADEEVVAMATSRLLAMGVCLPDGKPALTPAEATRVKRPVSLQMLAVLFELGGFAKKPKLDEEKPPNDSPPGTTDGSGT